ncbi:MAG: copper-binding protein [Hydrogenophaga sp.]|nr:copper-binding protein [Hydrogenophaga sp.]
MKTTQLALAFLLTAATLPGISQTTDHSAHHPAAAPASAPSETLPMAEAEVRRVDTAAKKISLKHGEIKNLDMPPMTMVFQVSDPALLDKVKAGDKVRFTAAQVNGAYTVLSIEPAP